MRKHLRFIPAIAVVAILLSSAAAQPPQRRAADDPTKEKAAKDYSNSSIVVKMMAFNKKKDGKLTKDEVTDTRLHRLFDMADTNHDGVVTKEELMALAAKMDAEFGQATERGGRGPGGPGGPGGGPPRPGQVLPPNTLDALKLTAEQKKQLEELQKDVDAKLDKLLTAEQKKQLKVRQDRGPGGFGRPGGDRPPAP